MGKMGRTRYTLDDVTTTATHTKRKRWGEVSNSITKAQVEEINEKYFYESREAGYALLKEIYRNELEDWLQRKEDEGKC